MSNSSIESEFSNIVNILFDNKDNIKTDDYMQLLNSLKIIHEKRPLDVKVITKKFCTNCLSSCSENESSDDSDDEIS